MLHLHGEVLLCPATLFCASSVPAYSCRCGRAECPQYREEKRYDDYEIRWALLPFLRAYGPAWPAAPAAEDALDSLGILGHARPCLLTIVLVAQLQANAPALLPAALRATLYTVQDLPLCALGPDRGGGVQLRDRLPQGLPGKPAASSFMFVSSPSLS